DPDRLGVALNRRRFERELAERLLSPCQVERRKLGLGRRIQGVRQIRIVIDDVKAEGHRPAEREVASNAVILQALLTLKFLRCRLGLVVEHTVNFAEKQIQPSQVELPILDERTFGTDS